jgi:hypothetical protein
MLVLGMIATLATHKEILKENKNQQGVGDRQLKTIPRQKRPKLGIESSSVKFADLLCRKPMSANSGN